MSPAGRRPGAPDTRATIVIAGREEFAEHGYSRTTIRQVARRAGVDPALVYHYFGDKAGLFVACLDLPADPRRVQRQSRRRDGRVDGARIVERFLAQWEEGAAEPGQPFVSLTQAVASEPEVARAIREFLTERVWSRPPAGADGDVALTAALVSSQLLGAAWARYVVKMEPFASATRREVAAWLGPTIEAYVTGRLGAPGEPSAGDGRPTGGDPTGVG